MATKLFPADTVFSNLIRERDNWTCSRCNTRYDPPTQALHCAHFYSRGKWSTRFDPRNAYSACYGCHRHWDGRGKTEYEDFVYKRLGDDEFNKLTLLAWNKSQYGSNFWKRLTKKQAEEILKPLFKAKGAETAKQTAPMPN